MTDENDPLEEQELGEKIEQKKPSKSKGKSRLSKFLNEAVLKIESVMSDRRVVSLTSIASSALDVASRIGQAKIGGPIAYIGAALGTIDSIRENLDIKKKDVIEDFLCDDLEDSYRQRQSFLGELLTETDSFDSLKTTTILESKDFGRRIEAVEDKAGKTLLLVVNSGGSAKVRSVKGGEKEKSDKELIERTIYVQDGFDFSTLSEAVWKAMGSRFLKVVGLGYFAKLVPVDTDDVEYIGVHSPAAMAVTIKKYNVLNISRSLTLTGKPGSGKTTFCKAYANHINGTLLIVPPETLNRDCRSEIEMFISLLKPDVLLLDDIDSATSGLTELMTLIIDARAKHPRMLVITTANDLSKVKSALLRPGRLGERLEFKAPSDEEKKSLLELYFRKYNVDATQFNIPELIKRMKNDGFTHDYVRFCAEQAVIMSQKELERYVEDANYSLDDHEEPSFSSEPDDDEDD